MTPDADSPASLEAQEIHAQNVVAGTQHISVTHIYHVYRAAGGTCEAEPYQHALESYLGWLSDSTGRVVLRGIKHGDQQVVTLDLQDVYVPLAAEALPEAREALKQGLRRRGQRSGRRREAEAETLLAADLSPQRISLQALLAQGQRLALIGAPGCGKTTVFQHIAWVLAESLRTARPALAAERLGLSGALPLPILAPLSLYAEHRRRFHDHPEPAKRQLATFLTEYLQERQAALRLPEDFFATLLRQGHHLLLLLDGLDEVPTEDERALVSQAVADLTYGRPQARLLVSSRTQAYQGKVVLGGDFRVVRVLPLEPETVASLMQQAYRAIYPSPQEGYEREQQAADLIAGVRRLEEERAARLGGGDEHRLVTTPLLVRMLLIVHFNRRHLPEQRAELYMEVVDTLLTAAYNPEQRVAQHLAGDWRNRRDLLQYLAWHMHSQGQQAGREMAEQALTAVLCAYLQERRDRPEAEAAAQVAELVAVSRQRGGLLEERAGQYRFSHLSFQEFLTARYLAEVEREVGRIVAFLGQRQRLRDAWWREVVLLTGGYLHITAPETATALLRRLAHLQGSRSPRTARALASAELAATIFLEWEGTGSMQQALAQRLADLLTDPAIPKIAPVLRAAAGRALARLGDPRPGVSTQEALPDIAWCPVPAGPFLLGANPDESGDDDEKPQHELTLPTFYIARSLLTNAQFAPFVTAGGYEEPRWWTEEGWAWLQGADVDLSYMEERLRKLYADWLAQRSVARRATPFYWDDERYNVPNQPIVGITWYEAMAYTAWLQQQYRNGNVAVPLEGTTLGALLASGAWQVRLPTEAEWEKAAGWDAVAGRKRVYAWGDVWDTAQANVAESGVKAPSAVGIFPAGASPCGALDMTGNVWEWTQSLYRSYAYSPIDGREDIATSGERVLRGGAWSNAASGARVSYRVHSHPGNWDDIVGLRLVVAPVFS
ncbi:MAG: SUMF1/EgtB/PvdO family nonheme iron enzyme [Candidatus Tectimicrobiota bacterium]